MMLFGPLFLEKCVLRKRTLFRPYFIEALVRKIPPRKKTNFHPKNRPLRSHKKIVFHNIPRKRTSFGQHISHIFTKKENLNAIFDELRTWMSYCALLHHESVYLNFTTILSKKIQRTWMSLFKIRKFECQIFTTVRKCSRIEVFHHQIPQTKKIS